MLLLVAMGGARGVGKTTLLETIANLSSDYHVVFIGEELNKFSLENYGIRFFDTEPQYKDIIREKYAKKLLSSFLSMSGIGFLDLHYTDIREKEGKMIQPVSILSKIDIFSAVDAETTSISQRILADNIKGRISALEHINKDRLAELSAAESLAQSFKKPYLYFANTGGVDELTREILMSIKPYIFGKLGKERL